VVESLSLPICCESGWFCATAQKAELSDFPLTRPSKGCIPMIPKQAPSCRRTPSILAINGSSSGRRATTREHRPSSESAGVASAQWGHIDLMLCPDRQGVIRTGSGQDGSAAGGVGAQPFTKKPGNRAGRHQAHKLEPAEAAAGNDQPAPEPVRAQHLRRWPARRPRQARRVSWTRRAAR